MAEEVVLTRFTADISELEAAAAQYDSALGDATKANEKLDESSKRLGVSVGNTASKFDVVRQSAERNQKSIKELRAEIEALEKRRVTLVNPTQIAEANKRIAALKSQITSLDKAGIDVKKSSGSLFDGIIGGASNAIPGLGGITSSFIGMAGPIGIAAAAVGGFIANFSRLDSVATGLDGVRIVFDNILDRLANLDFKGLFDPETQLRDIEFAVRQAAALDAVADVQLKINKQNAEAELQLAGLNQQLRDRTKTEAERLAIADQITSIENNRAKEEEGFIRGRIAIQQRFNDQQLESLGEVSDQNKAALNELEVQLLNAQARSIALTESTERRRNSIVEQGANERAASEQKSAAAREKAIADAARKAQIIEQAQQGINATLEKLASEELDRTATDAEREVNIVTRKYADIESKTKEGFEKIRQASSAEDRAQIEQQQADALVQITAARDAELAALEKKRADEANKTREEQLEQVRKSLLSETEAQREAILVKLDADRAAAEASITNLEERNAVIAELTKNAEAELTLVLSDEQKKRAEQDRAAQEAQRQLLEENATIISDFAVASGELIGQAAAGNEEIAKNAAKVLTTLLLDTLEKIVLANAFQVQAVSAGAPDPANVASGGTFGIARGIILAGLVKALFAAAKGAIQGAYVGEEYVGGTPMWSGKDGHLRRLHDGERVVTADKNRQHWDDLQAIHEGRYAQHVEDNYILPAIQALAYRDDAKVNEFVASDTGQRIASSVMLAKFYDANIVTELRSTRKEGRKQTELLGAMVKNLRPNRSRW